MIVRLKGVKKVRSKGKTYYYHRKTMTRLPGVPGGETFLSAFRSLETDRKAATASHTLGGVLAAYRASPEFASLAPATCQKYQQVFDDLKPLDGMPLAQITTEFLFALRDKKAAQRKRVFANRTISTLRLVFNWGMRRGKIRANPALSVNPVQKPRSAPVINRPWRREELAAVMATAPPWIRVAIALGAYTGLRSCDVVVVKWSCYDGKAFETRTKKTNMPVWVPAHSQLRAILDSAPRTGDTIVVGALGRSIGRSGLTTPFFDLLRRLREEGKVGPGLSFHGLRHTLGTALAEAGCDPPTIAAVLGQSTTQMAEHYSRTANRRGMATAAFEKLERRDMENETENRPVTR